MDSQSLVSDSSVNAGQEERVKPDIRDYFSKEPSSSVKAPWKMKITSENGRDLALRQAQVKRVKRENTGDLILESGWSVRASRAKLRLLISVPLDVLFEIFCHLMPLDILRLSRTTKEFRQLLLHRSSTVIWKAALGNIPKLPACPGDVSLPFWTHLVFDSHCQNCLTTNVKRFNFLLRVRLCTRCSKTRRLLSESNFKADTKENKLIMNCIPLSHWNGNNVKYCTVADRDQFLKEMANTTVTTSFVEEKQRLLKIRIAHTRLCKAWLNETEFARELELESIRDSRAADIRNKLVDMGYRPELEFLDDLDEDLCAIVPFPDIISFYEHPHVRPPKYLTEKVWVRIKEDMIRYMRAASVFRLENARCLVVDRRRTLIHANYTIWRTLPEILVLHPLHLPMPNAADIFHFNSLKKILDLPVERESEVQPDIGWYFENHFEADIKRWRLDCAAALMDRALSSRALESAMWQSRYACWHKWDENIKFLDRAVVVFRCKNKVIHWQYEEARLRADVIYPPGTVVSAAIEDAVAKEAHAPVMWYPQIFHHACTSMAMVNYHERMSNTCWTLCTAKHYEATKQVPWEAKTLEFDEKASRATRNILDACGMFWEKATSKELDERDPRLVCLKCTWGARCDGERTVRVWAWRDAVQHCLSAHFGNGLVTWECITEEDAAEARRLERLECTRRNFHTEIRQKRWRCMKCRYTRQDSGRMTWGSLLDHFADHPTHGNAEELADKENIVYYRDMDTLPREGPPVKMKPSTVPPPRSQTI